MAMTKFWVNDDGTLNQATDDSQDLSPLTEVLVAPESGKQVWNGSAWTDPNKVLVDKKRVREYPNLQEQLDMQYHDLVDGTTTWKDAVAKVKSDNPKA
jgi:hypothetical protein